VAKSKVDVENIVKAYYEINSMDPPDKDAGLFGGVLDSFLVIGDKDRTIIQEKEKR